MSKWKAWPDQPVGHLRESDAQGRPDHAKEKIYDDVHHDRSGPH